MTKALSIRHGVYGRVAVLRMDYPLVVHAHPQSHFLLKIDGGDTEFQVAGRGLALDDRWAIGVNAWEPHAYLHANRDRPTVLLVLYLEPRWLAHALAGTGERLAFPSPAIPVTAEMHQTALKVLDALYGDEDHAGADERLAERVIALFRVAAEAAGAVEKKADDERSGGRLVDYRVRRSIGYLQGHVGESINFGAVARASGLSRPHFFALFRRCTDLTPNQYFSVLRMERALSDLCLTEVPMNELSERLGFTAQSNFTRFFREHQGVSPSEYRHFASSHVGSGAPFLL